MSRRFLLVGLAATLPLAASGLLTVLSVDMAEAPAEPGVAITTESASALTTEAGDGSQQITTEE